MQRQRNPVLRTSPATYQLTGKEAFTALGVDPGFANLGLAVVMRPKPGALLQLVMLEVVETSKAPKKVMRDLRVAADDQRRLREFWDKLSHEIAAHRPSAMGVESYALFPGQLGGNSWKVSFAFQMSVCCGWAHGILPMVFRPDDLKRRLLGKNAGTKVAVADVLRTLVVGFGDALDQLPKTKREHAADAVGHALLALEEAAKMRAMYGGAF